MAERADGNRSPATEAERQADADRRQAPRLDKAFTVWIEGDRGPGMGVARNISEGGMFIETREPQPLGTQVRVSFAGASGEMTAVGEVRYLCHLLGRLSDGAPSEAAAHAAVRGMGIRFLYFEAAGEPAGLVH